MNVSLFQILLSLSLGIGVMVVLTAKYGVHAFFALILACFITGLGVQMEMPELLNAIKDGFGNIMKSLGLIIVMGTALGMLLERTGSTRVMAESILKLVGEKNATWAISLTGFIVGLPVFCDSGYIVLNGLNRSLAAKTRIPITVMSISLATGLYSVHCLVPPHPGVTTAGITLGVEMGKLIMLGILVAIPAMIVGHYWAAFAGKKSGMVNEVAEREAEIVKGPSVFNAFLPILVPILLIALRSIVLEYSPDNGGITKLMLVLGDPNIALSIGVILCFFNFRPWNGKLATGILQESAEKAGGILVIIGAGGAFGAVLTAAGIGNHIQQVASLSSLGILIPFLVAFLLKTALGSSTVAIITASSLVLPLLPGLHLDTNSGRILAVLSMGAGSMLVSHANDAYFWVISRFSGLDIKITFKVYSVASIWMGLTSMGVIYILSFILT